MVWFFERSGRRLRYEIGRQADGYRLMVAYPGEEPILAERFDEPYALQERTLYVEAGPRPERLAHVTFPIRTTHPDPRRAGHDSGRGRGRRPLIGRQSTVEVNSRESKVEDCVCDRRP